MSIRGIDENYQMGARVIVSDDSNYKVLRDITFPKMLVFKLIDFMKALQKED